MGIDLWTKRKPRIIQIGVQNNYFFIHTCICSGHWFYNPKNRRIVLIVWKKNWFFLNFHVFWRVKVNYRHPTPDISPKLSTSDLKNICPIILNESRGFFDAVSRWFYLKIKNLPKGSLRTRYPRRRMHKKFRFFFFLFKKQKQPGFAQTTEYKNYYSVKSIIR